MRTYRLLKGSYSYYKNIKQGKSNLYSTDDVMDWAYEIDDMIMDESEDNECIVVDSVESALDVLESANEYLELVTNF